MTKRSSESTKTALEESEARFQTIFESSLDAVVIVDDEGIYVQANPVTETILGLPPEQIVGHSISEFLTENVDLPALWQAFRGTGSFRGEMRLVRADGEIRYVEAYAVANILPGRHLAVLRDITERRQAEEKLRESEERYRRLFDEDLTGDFLATPGGKVLECNPAFAEIYGFADVTHALGCDISQFNPTDWADLMARLRAECKVRSHQCVHRRPDGSEIHVVANVVGQFNEAAELVEIQGYLYDDTERAHAEEALRNAAWFPEQNPAPVLRVARTGTLLYANDASAFLLRSWGCRPGQNIPEEIGRYVAQALDSGKTSETDVVCGPIIYSFSIAPVVSEGYANLYAHDITERKQAEEALRRSEEKFAKAFRSSPIAVTVTRQSDGQIVEVNEAVLKLLHFSRAEVIGHTTLDLGIWVNVNDRAQFIRKLSTTGAVRDLEYPLRTKDGAIVTVRLSAESLEFSGEPYLLSTLVDVTQQKEIEEALRESEERLKRAQRIAHLGSWELDLVNNHLSWSDEVYRIFGLQPQEFPATYAAFLEYVHPDDRAAVDAVYSGSLRTGQNAYEIEHRIVRRSTGEIRIVHEKCEHVRDASGRVIRSVGMVHDITERQQAEEALRYQRELLETVLNTVPVGVLFSDTDGNFTYANPHVSHILGQTPNGKVGSPAPDTYQLTKPDRTPFSHEEFPLIRAMHTGKNVADVEILVRRGDGQELTMLVNSAAVKNAQGQITGAVASLIDITDRKRAEKRLQELNATLESKVAQRTAELEYRARQLQKLALELSEAEDRERRHLAEILHDDLQQQLAAAKFHLDLLHTRAWHDPSQQNLIGQVNQMLLDAIQKSRNLSHELSPAVLYLGNLATTLEWLADQMWTKYGLEVKVDTFGEVIVESDALKSFLYKTAQEMLFNVVKHARIHRARIWVRRFGRYICLSVSDRGRGFDPQEVRQTTGFGLLSIRERIELLGGRMKMHGVPGRGSTFHIVVPDSSEPEGSEQRTEEKGQDTVPSSVSAPRSSVVRVLLADDHEIVREGLLSLLSEAPDIQVVGEAANGRETVDQAYRLRPDVVVMDVAMPLINGDDATRQIKLHLPETRVIALSMYEQADMVEKMRAAGAENYLLKTAPAEQLLAAIRGKKHAE